MRWRTNHFIQATVIFLIAVLTTAGCGGRLFTYKGDKVTQQNLIAPFTDGNQQGEWKTNELAIKYQYQMTHETMNIYGTVELLGGFAIGFSQIGRLAVYLLFLDDQGIVIENDLIYSVGNHHSINMIPMLFEKSIPIPAGVRAMSFAYDGVLVDPGDEDSTAYSIGFSPSR